MRKLIVLYQPFFTLFIMYAWQLDALSILSMIFPSEKTLIDRCT